MYTIDGKYTFYSSTYTYDSLKITFDGSFVTSVRGEYSSVYQGSTSTSSSEYKIDTKDGELTGTIRWTNEYSDYCSVAGFYGDMLYAYSDSSYSEPGLDVKESKGRVWNVETDHYTINGTTSTSTEYKDFEVDVYNDYILRSEGKVNGEDYVLKVYIYID